MPARTPAVSSATNGSDDRHLLCRPHWTSDESSSNCQMTNSCPNPDRPCCPCDSVGSSAWCDSTSTGWRTDSSSVAVGLRSVSLPVAAGRCGSRFRSHHGCASASTVPEPKPTGKRYGSSVGPFSGCSGCSAIHGSTPSGGHSQCAGEECRQLKMWEKVR